ncbi:MAG: hypothetical protein H0Z33_01215 [Bacillaceae bacterium]|nr:hypothetical protein [Bacillaceae bacterium]
MQLSRKNLAGAITSFGLVDRFLTRQGFRRKTRRGELMYGMRMEDSSTQSVYLLIIPVKMERMVNGGSTTTDHVRIGCPYLDQRKNGSVIPLSVRQAAEHKLAEIADYLKTEHSMYPDPIQSETLDQQERM